MRGLIRATAAAIVIGLFGLTCPKTSLANIAPPGEDALKSAIRTQIPTYWEVGSVKIVAEVNSGDAVNPTIKQRFEATAKPLASLHLPTETGTGNVLKPFIVLVETVPAGSARTLYGVASSIYRAGQWATEVVLESTVAGTGQPRSMFAGPTLVRGSDEERLARERMASAERADQEAAAALEALRGKLNTEAAQAAADHEGVIGKLRVEQVRVAQAAKAEIAQTKSTHEVELARLQSEHAQAIQEAEARREAAVKAALSTRDEKLEGLLAEKDALVNRAADELAAASARHSSELAALETKHAADLDALKRKHAIELEAEAEEVTRLKALADSAKQRTLAFEAYAAEKSRQIELRDKARLRLLEVAAVRADEFDEILSSLPDAERQTLIQKALDSNSPALRRELLRSIVTRRMRFEFEIEYFDPAKQEARPNQSAGVFHYSVPLADIDSVTGIMVMKTGYGSNTPDVTLRNVDRERPITFSARGITLTTQFCSIVIPFDRRDKAMTAPPQPCARGGKHSVAYRAALLY